MKTFCRIGVVLLLLSGNFALGQNAATTQEKRSTIVEVDGYAYLSEDKTMRDMRKEAMENAKRFALEQAQVYIKSFTKVENAVLSYDLIESGAEGYVKILESKDHGLTSDNRYHVWIKAEVEYALQPPQNGTSANLSTSEQAPLTVSVWTDKAGYQAGEQVQIFLQGNKDYYARVVYQDAAGNFLQLLPNQHRSDTHFVAAKILALPDSIDGFRLEVGPPFGEEWITVYASTAPQGEVAVQTYGKDLLTVNGKVDEMAAKTRGLKIVKKENSPSAAEFYEARGKIITMRKNDN